MLRNQAITQFREALLAQAEETKALLTEDRELLWDNPGPKSWSAMQCLEHLIMAGEFYQNNLRKELQKAKLRRADHEAATGRFGQKLANAMQPTEAGERKVKTPTSKKITPLPSDVSRHDQVVADYWTVQDNWHQLLDLSSEADWTKIRVVSLIGPILRFYIYDAFAINVAHQNRHLLQAREAVSRLVF
ncbi:MAG: DinB family protein [Bacteroidota bacterium]